jgi:hypothetical protein
MERKLNLIPSAQKDPETSPLFSPQTGKIRFFLTLIFLPLQVSRHSVTVSMKRKKIRLNPYCSRNAGFITHANKHLIFTGEKYHDY